MPATPIRPPAHLAAWVALLTALACFVPVSLLTGVRPAAAEPGAGTANNPWPTDCDMRIGVVVDRSHSIRAASESNPALVRTAVNDLADRLGGTGASMAVWSFSTLASGFSGPNPLGGADVDASDYPSIGFTPLDGAAGTDAVADTVDSIPFALPPADPSDPARDRLGATNWEAGLGRSAHGIPGAVAPNGDRPRDADVVVFVTDGNPTIENSRLGGGPLLDADGHVDAALDAAAEVKSTGVPTRLVAMGVGDVNAPNLERVTGGYPAAEESEDYWMTDFGGLGDALFDVASHICGSSLVLRKLVPGTEAGQWVPRAGWPFQLTFPDGTPAHLDPGTSLTTGPDGTARARWINPAGHTAVIFTEILADGERLGGVTCESTPLPEHGAEAEAVASPELDYAGPGPVSVAIRAQQRHETVCDVRNYQNGPDLVLEKTAEPAHLPAPGDVTFSLSLTNPDLVEPVRIDTLVDDHFGDLLDRDNPLVRDNTCDDSEPGSRVMAPGATGTCSFVARVEPAPDGGPHVDVVTVEGVELRPIGREGDDVLVSDDATVTFPDAPSRQPDLVVTNDDGRETVTAGDETTYTVTVTNDGDAESTGIALVDTLPPGTTFVSATGGAALDDGAGEAARDGAAALVWPWFGLAPGEERSVEVTIAVRDEAHEGDEVLNRAVALDDGGHGPDATPENNADADLDTVEATVPAEPPVDRPDDPAGIAGALPRTGADVAGWALWGGMLAAAGVALVGLARRAPSWRVRT